MRAELVTYMVCFPTTLYPVGWHISEDVLIRLAAAQMQLMLVDRRRAYR
jgi:hypothetical protein